MNDGIGAGKTRDDHANVSHQLYAAYSYVRKVETIASIIGENELSEKDKKCLEFGKAFEERFINQGLHEERSITKSLDCAWQLISMLPKEDLIRISEKQIEEHYDKKEHEDTCTCLSD